ncbi:MAG: SagB/ThcOx family dehydrogenase [Alphaproteobacteria bacterium]|nr:MAG: SagB/ThcOx family dehydrogenase [Alphaproteobacteria bacterium]
MWPPRIDPIPRTAIHPYAPVVWNIKERLSLGVSAGEELAPMSTTLDDRRSERTFAPIPEALLSALLWHTARTKESAPSPLGFEIEHRLTPSAGAIHPVHLVLQLANEGGWARYNPQQHSLDVLVNGDRLLQPLVGHSEKVMPRGNGRLILFVAEPGKTAAKYENSDSLIWRDAGILQGCLGLVAASLRLNYCLLGITGNPWVADLSNEGKLEGVGVAILGTRA